MQHTLQSSFSLSGKGLHTGLHLTVTFHPADEDHGYRIRRVDLEGQPEIVPLAENVIDTSRGTVVGTPDCRVSTALCVWMNWLSGKTMVESSAK